MKFGCQRSAFGCPRIVVLRGTVDLVRFVEKASGGRLQAEVES
jgi:hypothetical protein